jgi:hypothetical protein
MPVTSRQEETRQIKWLQDTEKRYQGGIISVFKCYCNTEFQHLKSEVFNSRKRGCTPKCVGKSGHKLVEVTNYTLGYKCYCEQNSNKCNCNRIVDITGKTFGRLTAIECIGKIKGKIHWKCICDCINKSSYLPAIVEVSSNHLINGLRKSCGCINNPNLIQLIFGRLKVLERTDLRNKWGNTLWKCQCSCPEKTIKYVSTTDLTRGNTSSCGCITNERIAKLGKSQVGENNPRWNPNLTNKERGQRRICPKFTKWRKKVYIRDNYTCQCCGQYGGKLEAHHLDGFHWFKKGRYNVNNGITLCRYCHEQFHAEYGKEFTTKEDFYEFLVDELWK